MSFLWSATGQLQAIEQFEQLHTTPEKVFALKDCKPQSESKKNKMFKGFFRGASDQTYNPMSADLINITLERLDTTSSVLADIQNPELKRLYLNYPRRVITFRVVCKDRYRQTCSSVSVMKLKCEGSECQPTDEPCTSSTPLCSTSTIHFYFPVNIVKEVCVKRPYTTNKDTTIPSTHVWKVWWNLSREISVTYGVYDEDIDAAHTLLKFTAPADLKIGDTATLALMNLDPDYSLDDCLDVSGLGIEFAITNGQHWCPVQVAGSP